MTEKTNGMGATSKQVRAIYAIAREQGINSEKLKKHIEEHYGVDSVDKLTKEQASKLIDKLRKVEEVNGIKDNNGKGIKEVRAKITRIEERMAEIEERLMKLEVRYEKILSKLIDDIEIKQGVRIAEVEREVRAMRHMLKEYFKEEKSDSEKDDDLDLVCMNCGGKNIKQCEDGGFYCDDCGSYMVKHEEERL